MATAAGSRGQQLHDLSQAMPLLLGTQTFSFAMSLRGQSREFPLLCSNTVQTKHSSRSCKKFLLQSKTMQISHLHLVSLSLYIMHFFSSWICLQCWDISWCWRELLYLVPWVSKNWIPLHRGHHICVIPIIPSKCKLWWEKLLCLKYVDFIVS